MTIWFPSNQFNPQRMKTMKAQQLVKKQNKTKQTKNLMFVSPHSQGWGISLSHFTLCLLSALSCHRRVVLFSPNPKLSCFQINGPVKKHIPTNAENGQYLYISIHSEPSITIICLSNNVLFRSSHGKCAPSCHETFSYTLDH